MTEDTSGGTAPEPEATDAIDEATPETAVAVTTADEPATSPDAPEASADPAPDAVEAVAETPAEAPEPEAPSEPEPVAAAVEAPVADAVEAAAPDTEAPATDAAAPAAESAPVPAAEAAAPESVISADEAADAPAAAEEEEPVPVRELGPEPTTMEELLAEQDSDIKSFKHGDVVDGTVVRIDKDEILVDIGAKSEGVVSNRELFGRHGEGQPELKIGDTVLVYVLQPESPEGHVVLSLRRAGLERKWRAMQEQFEEGVIIEAPVIDHNKGGLIVDCGIRGFVPISQIVDFPRRPQNDQPRDAAQEIAEKLQPFVGRKLRLKILEVNRKANRLILSEKVALYEERREKRDELFSSLQVGQTRHGHRALDRAVRRVHRPRRHRRPGPQERAQLEQGQQPRGRLQGRRRGRGRGHRHQPRARPDQPVDPPPPARPVAVDGRGLQGRRRHRRHGHQARQLRRVRPRPRRASRA